jgi:hypothetical protein
VVGGWRGDWHIKGPHEKRFFVTETGDIGQSSVTIAAGDEIWMLGDSWVLFTLRQVSKDQYTLQGAAYLDSVYEGSSDNREIRGTGTKYPRSFMGSVDRMCKAVKEGEYESTPFFELYGLNPERTQKVNIG